MQETQYDSVIVGAGFAGLQAALTLKKQGLHFLVLEAQESIGGRVRGQQLADGTLIELGGQWFGPTQRRVVELVERHTLPYFKTPPFNGLYTIEYQNQVRRADPNAPTYPDEIQSLLDKINILSQEAIQYPFNHPKAREWDNITMAGWINAQSASPSAKKIVSRVASDALISGNSTSISFLENLFYIAGGDGIGVITGFEGGAQNFRLQGGMHTLAVAMGHEVGLDHIEINMPVLSIEHDTDFATVHTRENSYTTQQVIITIPLSREGSIEYRPALAARAAIPENVILGAALKVHFVYKTPFWREAGLSGCGITETLRLTEFVDNTTPDSKHGVLTGFVYGEAKEQLMSQTRETRQTLITEDFVTLFGERARDILEYCEIDWESEPWINGCFSSTFKVGSFKDQFKPLRESIGNLHFAGTETAYRWNGYIDGALESGERAALKAINALKR